MNEFTIKNFTWSSDWNGYEVGHPNVEVIGLYHTTINNVEFSVYVDMTTNEVVEMWLTNQGE